MTQCSFGTERIPGSVDWIWIGARAVIAWFSVAFARIAGYALPFIRDDMLSADILCAEEPPIPTTPTLSQWIGAVAFNVADTKVVVDYVRDLYISEIWPLYCRCTPGTPGTCATIAVPWTSLTDLGDPGDNRAWGLVVNAVSGARTIYGAEVYNYGTPTISRLILWDATTTTILRQKNTAVPGSGHKVIFFDTPYVIPSSSSVTVSYSWSGTQKYYSWGANAAPASSDGVTYSSYVENSDYSVCPTAPRSYKAPLMPITCSSGTPADYSEPYTPIEPVDPTDLPDIPSATCTTTADLCTRLLAIENQLRWIDRSVAWLQGGLAPDSWYPDTPVTGITGETIIFVEGILGLFVTASVPSGWGKTYEVPPRWIPALGSIQWSIDGVPMDSQLIHYDEQHIFGAPPACDEVIVNFRAGVVGSVTPLKRFK